MSNKALTEHFPNSSLRFDWNTLVQLASSHRQQLIAANVIALFAAVASIPVPLLMPLLVDEVLLNTPGTLVNTIDYWFPESWQSPVLYILTILAATVFLRILGVVFNIWQAQKFTLIAKDIVFQIRKQLIYRLRNIPMSEYETLGSGKIITYLVTDLETIDQFIGSTISKFIVSTLSIIGTAAVLLWMHWQLALFILCLNPAVIFLTMQLGKRVKKLKRRENNAFEIFQQSLSETLTAIHQIRASNRETHYLKRLSDAARCVREDSANYNWKSDAANRFSFFVFVLGFDIFRALSMLTVVFSDLSIGEMLAVFGYLWFMMSPVQDVLNIQYSFYSAKAALGRINQLATLKQEKHYPKTHDPFLNKTTVSIECRQLSFSYNNKQPVLNDISFKINAGEKVAFTGISGGGKSTLIQVLIGLYPASEGEIRYDGISIEQIGFETVREHVVTVLQNPILFDASVRDNLSLGRHYDDALIWQALAIAQLDKTVHNLPEQLDTRIGQSGIRLSGGQRQRLAIARMVLAEPKVVIMDEATSALDAETETRLFEALNEFLTHRTTLIIAHRPSAIEQADRIFHFQAGKLQEICATQAFPEKKLELG